MSPSRLVANVLFPCPPATYTIDSFPGEIIWIPRGPLIQPFGSSGASTAEASASVSWRPPSGETVPCLLLPYESARFIIIFFHSNAEDLGRCRWFCHFLREQFQVHVLAVEYPGYGVCVGPPSREAVLANAYAALHFTTQTLKLPLEQIKLFGRSIGTGPALHLAARFKVAGLVLVTPFMSVKQLFRDRVGIFSLFVEEWFQNDEAIIQVDSPTMFIHGREDAIIPWRHSEVLYKTCSARRLFINPAELEHNTNLTSDMSYLIVPMFRFFSLPDYSFQQLEVPTWAFDKRRSPFYVRPRVEVWSRSCVPPGLGQGGGIAVPAGDDEEAPVDQDREVGQAQPEDLRGRAPVPSGDTPIADYEKVTVLTHPTVLHAYKATKQSYDFQGGSRFGRPSSLSRRGDGEEAQLDLVKSLRCSTLGDHLSASSPPRTALATRSLSIPTQSKSRSNPVTKAASSGWRMLPCGLTMRGASRGWVPGAGSGGMKVQMLSQRLAHADTGATDI